MENKTHQKYGLPTAISMVVGTVIGSGIFFKASDVLHNNGGNMIKSILTVITVGLVMLVCAFAFSILASKIDKVNGMVDYAESAGGPLYAYVVGWFAVSIFYPTITSCLSWISANYIIYLFKINIGWWFHYVLAAALLVLSAAFNILSPKISGMFQVSTTVIKLVPILIMAVVGTAVGLINGTTVSNLSSSFASQSGEGGGLFAAIVAFAFAYEGWIFATTINSEIKDSKKNLPRALFLGAIIIISVYVLYFFGIMGALSTEEIIEAGDELPRIAFSAILGSEVFGTIAYVFIIISCIGTMNGLVLATSRGMYSLAVRGNGICPSFFSRVNKKTDMPIPSAILGIITCLVWLSQWQLGFIQGFLPAFLSFENDELPIITFYASCIPVFIYIMKTGKDLGVFKRFIIPSLASVACVFMVFCAFYSYKIEAVYYLIVFSVIMLFGLLFYKRKAK
ncbi:MAG: APC family permease [Clostridia bacterium]|nr:APC family permease [Clostridia bacterium]